MIISEGEFVQKKGNLHKKYKMTVTMQTLGGEYIFNTFTMVDNPPDKDYDEIMT